MISWLRPPDNGRWLTAEKPAVMSIIIGAKTVAQLDDNLGVTSLTLTADEIAKLDAVSALPAEYPGWMLQTQGANRIPEPFVKSKTVTS